MCRRVLSVTLAVLACLLTSGNAKGQGVSTSVFASGLKAPIKSILTPKGNLLVAEAGNGPNTGRISIIDGNGNRRTLIDGLPSGLAPPNLDPSGPSGLALRGRMLFITIGAGDGTLPGPLPATEMANPNPSSPFLSSVLMFRLSPQVEDTTQGFTLTSADQADIQNRGFAKLADAAGSELFLEVLVNFRNYTADSRPNFAFNVRASNPFGITVNGRKLYVVDASQNQVWEVDSDTGERRSIIVFGPRQNPLFPNLGPPFIDPVPDSVRLIGKSLLVPLLSGFPFAPGTTEIRKVRLVNGANEPFISGLSSAIDVLPFVDQLGVNRFFVLEFSTNMLAGAPGRLSRYDQPDGAPVVLVSNLTSPTSLVRDEATGDLFVTEIFPGRITRVKVQ
jgi:hypothetical protein